MNNMDYPTIKEQKQAHTQIKHKYGSNIKIDRWNHKDTYIYFEISNHNKYVESNIQADYYAEKYTQSNIKYLEYNRTTTQINELSRDQLFFKRGWIFDNKGIIQFHK